MIKKDNIGSVCIKKKRLLCFDSIGIDIIKKKLLEQYCNLKGTTELMYNETQFQLSTTDTCGKFVIYFLIQKSYNKDLNFTELLEEIFVDIPSKNEIIIQKFFDKVFKDV